MAKGNGVAAGSEEEIEGVEEERRRVVLEEAGGKAGENPMISLMRLGIAQAESPSQEVNHGYK